MQYAYPCMLKPEEDGVSVSFPDIPGALTCGSDRRDALEQATDALVAALCAYVYAHEGIPEPSAAVDGQELVTLPLIVAAKLALYTTMRKQDITTTALARTLGLSAGAVCKLLDPDHCSQISQIEKALKALDRNPMIVDWAA